jgi:citrate/tricarballylate utilization protein
MSLPDDAGPTARGAELWVPREDPVAEVERQMRICNACRYCEGFCAVFPAMARRLDFPAGDVHYLANLCHNCSSCYYACQYAPPHDFAINVPRAMAQVRQRTYADYAWPRVLGALYERNGTAVSLATALGLIGFMLLALVLGRPLSAGTDANFFAIFSHGLLVAIFGAAFGFAVLALAIGVSRFWRAQDPGPASPAAAGEAVTNALVLKYLDGGHGEGCNETDDRFTLVRRYFHHLTFYGFLFCFASTAIATVYHIVLGWHAPYARDSIPVVLGTIGGIALFAGAAGLLVVNLRRDPAITEPSQRPMERGFALLLLATSATGLALLAWRATPSMPVLLIVHLGFVMGLFLTLPYGKFAHGVYRAAALLKWSIERSQPNPNLLSD